MRNIQCILTGEQIQLSDYNSSLIKDKVRENGSPIRAHIVFSLPESRQARKYLMGGILPLAVYLDGQDYKDNEVLERYFEHYKREFYPVAVKIEGKIELFGQTTKGSKNLARFTERLQDYLHEQHGVSYDNKAMSSEAYKEWRDTMASFSNEDWIENCVKLKYIE